MEAKYDLVIEASTMGLRPGYWPKQITFDNGVVATAHAQKRDMRENELIGVIYRTFTGHSTLILND